MSNTDDTSSPPVGWKIVATGEDGSVLCSSPTGQRCRYWFRGKLETAVIDTAIKVIRLASIGDQNFIPSLNGNDPRTEALRHSLVDLADVLRDT